MSQTYIFFTQTKISNPKLSKFLAHLFFKGKLSPTNVGSLLDSHPKDYNQENLQKLNIDKDWQKYINAGQILLADFKNKLEFREELSGYYQHYDQPSLLFLGSLNDYSLPLQEGMLRILEEPPHNLSIIIYAQDTSQVLPTILSRSKQVFLPLSLVKLVLDQEFVAKIKKKTPDIKSCIKQILSNSKLDIPDTKNLEREEIDFWLWQIAYCLEEVFKVRPDQIIAKKLFCVVRARKLNYQNLQKKFVLESLNIK